MLFINRLYYLISALSYNNYVCLRILLCQYQCYGYLYTLLINSNFKRHLIYLINKLIL